MNVLVCGSLAWSDKDAMVRELSLLPKDSIILEGEAPGADTLARLVAQELGLGVQSFPKDPNDGKAADVNRDRRMFTEGQPDLVLIYHDDIENSRGSKEQRQRAIKRGIKYKVITTNSSMEAGESRGDVGAAG